MASRPQRSWPGKLTPTLGPWWPGRRFRCFIRCLHRKGPGWQAGPNVENLRTGTRNVSVFSTCFGPVQGPRSSSECYPRTGVGEPYRKKREQFGGCGSQSPAWTGSWKKCMESYRAHRLVHQAFHHGLTSAWPKGRRRRRRREAESRRPTLQERNPQRHAVADRLQSAAREAHLAGRQDRKAGCRSNMLHLQFWRKLFCTSSFGL